MQEQYEQPSWRNWLAVGVLGVGSFAIVTTELAPIGILSSIAGDLGENEAKVGLIVTGYAWIAAAAALLSATLLGRMPRKPLLVSLMLVLAMSSAVAAITTTFSALFGARIIGAVAHGAFWAMIGTLGAQIVPARHVGVATSIIFGGVSAASVLGVPLAGMIGHLEGWRTAFGVIAALSFLTAAAIMLSVPHVSAAAPVGRQALIAIARDPACIRIYAATACAITAHFAAFTYIEPLLSDGLRIQPNVLYALLLAFGLAGLLGNVITGIFVDRYLKLLVLGSLILMAICLAGLGVFGANADLITVGILLMGWGIGVAAVFVGFQTWILRTAGDAVLPASAIYVAIFNAAIGSGALLGSVVMSFTELAGLMAIAALALVGSLVPVILLSAPTVTMATGE
ncbi:MFS transporter [Agrobacterium tumefaciens]|uniref:MFS transporter n=1 Tax=Agrobacterium tumefaciens TaxID=358 RepID=UPI0012B9E053|nr:MFS transporter [Agrobacterium tumefaciens]MQB07980.1 MFS transporter [Agrobacterium tumefaciens]